jgi:hypothetical protein
MNIILLELAQLKDSATITCLSQKLKGKQRGKAL